MATSTTSGGDASQAAPLSGEPEIQRPVLATAQAEQPEAPGLLSDCRVMLRYAKSIGLPLSSELMRAITWLDAVLKLRNISPISAISLTLVSNINEQDVTAGYIPDPPASPPRALPPEEVVLRVHADLSAALAPTTALSLQTSEPPPGRMRIFGGMPRLVRTAIVVAVVSSLVFVFTAVAIKRFPGGGEEKTDQSRLNTSGAPSPGASSSSTGQASVAGASSPQSSASAASTVQSTAPAAAPSAQGSASAPAQKPVAGASPRASEGARK